jgi:hypothetical protein
VVAGILVLLLGFQPPSAVSLLLQKFGGSFDK